MRSFADFYFPCVAVRVVSGFIFNNSICRAMKTERNFIEMKHLERSHSCGMFVKRTRKNVFKNHFDIL